MANGSYGIIDTLWPAMPIVMILIPYVCWWLDQALCEGMEYDWYWRMTAMADYCASWPNVWLADPIQLFWHYYRDGIIVFGSWWLIRYSRGYSIANEELTYCIIVLVMAYYE